MLLPAARVALVAFLFVLVPLVFQLSPPNLGDHPLVVAWIFLLASAIRISILAFRPKPALLDITFWVFVYIFFGAAAINQLEANHFPLSSGSYPEPQILATQLRIAVGIACYCVGRWVWARVRHRDHPLVDWDRFEIVESRVVLLALIAIPVALALIAKNGIRTFFESRYSLALTLYNASGKVIGYHINQLGSKASGSFQQVLLTVPLFVALVYFIVTGSWRRHKALFAAVVLLCVITNNPVSNPRTWTAVVAVGILAALIQLSRRSRHAYFALGLLVLTLFSLSYLNVFRAPATTTNTANSTAAKPLTLSQELQTSDYGMFQQELNATVWIQSHGFTGGQQLAGAAFVYVPRSLWHSKAIATGNLVSQQIEVNNDNSSTLWTEFFIDFGYPELVLCFLLLGYFFSYLDNVFMSSRSLAAQVIIPIAATYGVLFLRGSLQPTVAYGIPLFIVLFLCLHRKSTDRTRTASSSGYPDARGIARRR